MATSKAAPEGTVLGGAAAKDATLDAAVFGAELKQHLVHEVVRAELNAHRAAPAARRAVGSSPAAARSRGARRAPAGHAQGTIRAPHFTGGGVAFRRACAASRSR